MSHFYSLRLSKKILCQLLLPLSLTSSAFALTSEESLRLIEQGQILSLQQNLIEDSALQGNNVQSATEPPNICEPDTKKTFTVTSDEESLQQIITKRTVSDPLELQYIESLHQKKQPTKTPEQHLISKESKSVKTQEYKAITSNSTKTVKTSVTTTPTKPLLTVKVTPTKTSTKPEIEKIKVQKTIKTEPKTEPKKEDMPYENIKTKVIKPESDKNNYKPSAQKTTGLASYYANSFNGKKTASGELYNSTLMTAAHPTLPLKSHAKVTNPSTGKSVIVKINDRGPYAKGRIVDVSAAAAEKLGMIQHGIITVILEPITFMSAQLPVSKKINLE